MGCGDNGYQPPPDTIPPVPAGRSTKGGTPAASGVSTPPNKTGRHLEIPKR
jgi:hypothetical protein